MYFIALFPEISLFVSETQLLLKLKIPWQDKGGRDKGGRDKGGRDKGVFKKALKK